MADSESVTYDNFTESDDDSEFEIFGPEDVESDIEFEECLTDNSSSESEDEADTVRDKNYVGKVKSEPDEQGDWTSEFSSINIQSFTRDVGPILPDTFDKVKSRPIDYFYLMFNEAQFSNIARHTNNYAKWKMEASGEPDIKWSETNSNEIKAFVAINILMGVISLPDTCMYWSSDDLLGNHGIKKIMSCNRFEKLMQYFHVSDRKNEPQKGHVCYDRLYKVRETIDHTLETFQNTYNLSRNISIDETVVRYSGKLSFKQCMPTKPIKRGIKIWMRCDAETAYLSKFQIYLGKSSESPSVENGLGYQVVSDLTDDLQGSFHNLYFDNYLTSVKLLEDLLFKDLYACGKFSCNRKGFPSQFKTLGKMAMGEYMMLQKGNSNLTASVWNDKKRVYYLSTLGNPTIEIMVTRKAGGNTLELLQPLSVHMYNKYMGGVHMHDRLRLKYDVGRASKKWWRYLFWFLINCSIVNAFIIYNSSSQRREEKKPYRHVDFRLELSRDLIGEFSSRKRRANEQRNVLFNPDNLGLHINEKLPGSKRRCKHHTKVLHQRKETVYGCSVCRVHLCRDGCHYSYHNQ